MTLPAHLQLVSEVAVPLPSPENTKAWAPGHDVQFYESEEFLYGSVASFLNDGVKAGQPFIVIATPAHRKGITARLNALGVNLELMVEGRDMVWLDARETLAGFMVGSSPDRALFEATVGSVFERLITNRRYLVVRAYGEMVDLLWKDGNVEGALALEDLWNELAVKYSFSLLCAYSMGNFFKEAHTHSFRQICEQHTKVAPTESYLLATDSERLRQITLLQQRARALEAEIQHRRELEQGLREVLSHRARTEEALRRSERDMRDFLDNAPEGLHWVGPDGIIQWANNAELEMLGYSREEYIGQHIARFHADSGVIADILTRLTRFETLRNYRARLIAKDGSVKDVLISSSVYRVDGEFVHTRCFTRDVTGMAVGERKS